MPVRIFKYIAVIWDHLRKQAKSKTIPLVYPVIIYNGDRPYSHSLTLSDLIEPDASRKLFNNLFTKPFCLVDLPAIEDDLLLHHVSKQTQNKELSQLCKLPRDILQIIFAYVFPFLDMQKDVVVNPNCFPCQTDKDIKKVFLADEFSRKIFEFKFSNPPKFTNDAQIENHERKEKNAL